MDKKSTYRRRRITWALLIIGGMAPILAQDVPDTPKLLRATVDHADQGVLIQWEASKDTTVDLYNVYKMESAGALKLFTVGAHPTVEADTFNYKHLGSGLIDLEYAVTAEDTLDGSASRESPLGDNVHKVVSTSLEFDPCEKIVLLEWTGYVGWGSNISGYIIHGGPSGVSPDTLGLVSADVLAYTDQQVEFGEDYVYYIEAVHSSGLRSLSPLDTISAFFPDAPETLRIDWISVLENARVELQFTTDTASLITHYLILKKTDAAADYTELTSLVNSGQPTYLVEDSYPSTKSNQYYLVQAQYQAEGCSSSMVVAESNTGTSIHLQSAFDNQVVQLQWTAYESYATGLSGYIVQRMNASGEFIDVATLGADQLSWEESIETVINSSQPGSILYRVQALSNQVPGADPGISISNISTVAIESTLQVPSAFTPGSDDINALFKPQVDFAPTAYIMIIYDRAGRKLFESTDPNEGWDGSFDGKSLVMEGVYIYYIQYRDHTGRFKSLTGNVAAIYP